MKRFAQAQVGIGAALILLGVTVMLGWALRNAAMVQVLPDFIGMVFNTALFFALIGVALLLTPLKAAWARSAQTAIGGGVIGLALVVLIEKICDKSLGIDFTY